MLRTLHAVRVRRLDQGFVCPLNLEAKIVPRKRKRLLVFLKVALSTVKFLNGVFGARVLPLVAFV
jgi:hypothetical protein